MSEYGVEIVTLSPGRWEDDPHHNPLGCREMLNYLNFRHVAHDWELMQGPPDPIWWCRRCQRIEQRVLKERSAPPAP